MNEETKKIVNELIALKRNPYADSNNIQRLKKSLEWINVSPMKIQERKLLAEACE